MVKNYICGIFRIKINAIKLVEAGRLFNREGAVIWYRSIFELFYAAFICELMDLSYVLAI